MNYTMFGLTVRTPFRCPILPVAPADAAPDVTVVEGPVPRRLQHPAAEGPFWQTEPGRFLVRAGRRAGRFLVEDGRKVTLQRNPAAEDEMLCFHFLDSVLSAILRHRGYLVLHANAAVTPSGAVAVSGESGSGKSTTLAALVSRGCPMLSDDITALRLSPEGRVEAVPGVPQLHLCEDAAAGLGRDIAGQPRYAWRRMKAAVPTATAMAGAPAPLRALYLLDAYPGEDLEIHVMRGGDGFAALQECVYGPLLPGDHPALFPLFTAVTGQAPVIRLRRPSARWTVDDVVDTVLNGSKWEKSSGWHPTLSPATPGSALC